MKFASIHYVPLDAGELCQSEIHLVNHDPMLATNVAVLFENEGEDMVIREIWVNCDDCLERMRRAMPVDIGEGKLT